MPAAKSFTIEVSEAMPYRMKPIEGGIRLSIAPAAISSALGNAPSTTRKSGKPARSSTPGTSAIPQPRGGVAGFSGQVEAKTTQRCNRGEGEAEEPPWLRNHLRHSRRHAHHPALVEERNH